MKLSETLNLMVIVATFFLIIFVTARSFKSGCFTWFDYLTSFVTLFGNMGISILSAYGR